MYKKISILSMASLFSLPVFAQSSVTLYGIISTGVEYVSNVHGSSAVQMVSGADQNNRFGFRIREDLGGGYAAVSQLENGFASNSGALGQGGRMFGRLAFVGLSSNQYGTLTFGRQYDMLFDFLNRYEPQSVGPGMGTTIGSNDNVEGNFRYSNSIKYVSPSYSGVRFEGLYAMSNKAGDFAQNRAFSTGVGYDGDRGGIALVYVSISEPGLANPGGAVSDDYSGAGFQQFHSSPLDPSIGVRRQQVVGVGGHYLIGQLTLAAMFTGVQYSYLDNTGLHLDNYDVAASYQLTPSLSFSAAYLYTNGRYQGVAANPHWNQGQLSVDYALSKRTDLVLYGNYVRSSGPLALAPAVIFLQSPSSTHSQAVVLGGIRHLF